MPAPSLAVAFGARDIDPTGAVAYAARDGNAFAPVFPRAKAGRADGRRRNFAAAEATEAQGVAEGLPRSCLLARALLSLRALGGGFPLAAACGLFLLGGRGLYDARPAHFFQRNDLSGQLFRNDGEGERLVGNFQPPPAFVRSSFAFIVSGRFPGVGMGRFRSVAFTLCIERRCTVGSGPPFFLGEGRWLFRLRRDGFPSGGRFRKRLFLGRSQRRFTGRCGRLSRGLGRFAALGLPGEAPHEAVKQRADGRLPLPDRVWCILPLERRHPEGEFGRPPRTNLARASTPPFLDSR